MPDGMHLMIPAEEYARMEAKIERLEKALDKACRELDFYSRGPYEEPIIEVDWTVDQWKEWCMNDENS